MKPETVIRIKSILRLAVTLLVSVLAALNIQLDADTVMTIATAVLAVVCMAWSWWKNNDMTQAAMDARAMWELSQMPSDEATDAELPDQTPEPDFDDGSDYGENAEGTE